MRGKRAKTVISGFLGLTMTFGMVACGGGDGDELTALAEKERLYFAEHTVGHVKAKANGVTFEAGVPAKHEVYFSISDSTRFRAPTMTLTHHGGVDIEEIDKSLVASIPFDPLTGLKAFVAAVLGGIGNVRGAVVGALIMGLSEQYIVVYGSSTFRDALAFVILIGILLGIAAMTIALGLTVAIFALGPDDHGELAELVAATPGLRPTFLSPTLEGLFEAHPVPTATDCIRRTGAASTARPRSSLRVSDALPAGAWAPRVSMTLSPV